MRLAACKKLRLKTLVGVWYRAILPHHWKTLLHTSHTSTSPGRFNGGTNAKPGFEILYLAEDPIVALFEAGALLGLPPPGPYISHPRHAWTILNVRVHLQNVVDLSSVVEQRKLGTTVQELTGDWRGYRLRSAVSSVSQPIGLAPTQNLGQAIFGLTGLEGFEYTSSKVPHQRCLAVFPQTIRQQTTSSVSFFDPIKKKNLTIP
jgi:hypothetical protein